MISEPFHFLTFYVIFILCSMTLPTMATSGNNTDLLSLMAIKDRIQGLSWWNQSIHFCEWQGITCSKRHQRVISLNVSGQNLVGSISPHIGNLSFLRFIDLRENNFFGEIPQEIGQLFRLRHLNMTNNTFEGNIPVNLTQCTDLTILNLGGNKLFGKIPLFLGSLSKLVFLSLQRNNLTGEIPPSLGNISSLQIFSLAYNGLEGSIPDTLGRLSSLKLFLAASNRLSGKVPLSIYNISSIDRMSFSLNQLIGSIPPDVGITLPKLVQFQVGGNQLTGPLPVSLANASMIQQIDFSRNNFTGQIPTNWGTLKNLYWINLSNNYLGRGEQNDLSFITNLTNSSNLRVLSLSGNHFGGVFPKPIFNLSTQMEMLYLGGNQISGIIPEGFEKFVNLIALGLEGNRFNGNIPSSFGKLQNLQRLFVDRNMLAGLIPSSLANITRLSQLSLADNKLEGNLPSNFGGFKNLQLLSMARNNLLGNIPHQIFGISSLSIDLDLSQNSFTGSLPLEVGNLQNLGQLDVSGNKLSGEIPPTLGNCLSMEDIDLEGNQFEGTIPQSLSSLKSIRNMDLSGNKLSGGIPTYLQNLLYLQKLNLSFNNFEGEVPTKGIFKNASSFSVDGNVKLCGGIHGMQLPKCETKDTTKQGRSNAFKLAIAISLSLLSLVALSFFILFWKRTKKFEAPFSLSMKYQPLKVSYRDLFRATGGFSPTNLLGSGSFGHVFKGKLQQDDMIVAVKVFNLHQKGASNSFLAECESLRNIRHRNLVKIITSCSSTDFEGNDFKALVFEFMPNGSLEMWLHGDTDRQDATSRNLNLHQRLNIAIDIASALNYLHHQCDSSIVHRDLKPSNVLLDQNMIAHVSDFGLAKLLSGSTESLYNNQSASIGVKGSIGYVAPEYGLGGEASIHGDVYSYGILLLELFIGRRPTDDMFKDGLNLHNYASKAFPDQVLQIVDPPLLTDEDGTSGDTNSIRNQEERRTKLLDCLTSILRIGVGCSVELPLERMEVVTGELQLIRDKYFGTAIHGTQ